MTDDQSTLMSNTASLTCNDIKQTGVKIAENECYTLFTLTDKLLQYHFVVPWNKKKQFLAAVFVNIKFE